MILTPEFVAAEVEYRTNRMKVDYREARSRRSLRSFFHLPALSIAHHGRTLANS